jgi:hypothetical protein
MFALVARALLVWALRLARRVYRQVDHRLAAQTLKNVEAFAVGV